MINSLILQLTDNCNLQCKYCFVKHKNKNMNLEECKKIINFFILNSNQNEKRNITFFGGEPLLLYNEIIKPIVLYIIEEKQIKNISFSITTNGILLNEEKLKFFIKYNFSLLLSMDGDKFTQDYNRPSLKNNFSSFDILNQKIEIIKQYYPNISIRGTIYPDTCHLLYENFIFFIKHNIKNICFFPDEFSQWTEQNLENLKKELRKITLFFLINNNKQIIFTPYQDMIELLTKTIINKNIIKNKNICEYCGLGDYCITINYNGDIFACQELASYPIIDNPYFLGNINNNKLDNSKIQNLKYLLQNNKIIPENEYFCNTDCQFKDFCKINICHANNFLKFHMLNKKSFIKCFWENTIYLESLFLFTLKIKDNLFLNKKNEGGNDCE